MIFYGKDTGDGSVLTCSRRLYCDCWCSFTAHMQRQYRTKSGEYLSQQHNSWWVDTVRFSKDSDKQVLMYILITTITLDSLTLICSHNDKQVWNLVIVTGSCQDKCNQNGDQLLYYDNYSENTLVVCKDDLPFWQLSGRNIQYPFHKWNP